MLAGQVYREVLVRCAQTRDRLPNFERRCLERHLTADDALKVMNEDEAAVAQLCDHILSVAGDVYCEPGEHIRRGEQVRIQKHKLTCGKLCIRGSVQRRGNRRLRRKTHCFACPRDLLPCNRGVELHGEANVRVHELVRLDLEHHLAIPPAEHAERGRRAHEHMHRAQLDVVDVAPAAVALHVIDLEHELRRAHVPQVRLPDPAHEQRGVDEPVRAPGLGRLDQGPWAEVPAGTGACERAGRLLPRDHLLFVRRARGGHLCGIEGHVEAPDLLVRADPIEHKEAVLVLAVSVPPSVRLWTHGEDVAAK